MFAELLDLGRSCDLDSPNCAGSVSPTLLLPLANVVDEPPLLSRPIRLRPSADVPGDGSFDERTVTLACPPGRYGRDFSFSFVLVASDVGTRCGGGIVVGRVRFAEAGEEFILALSDDRLLVIRVPDPGPVDRFRPAEVDWANRCVVGSGIKVGVDGREAELAIELAVLALAPDDKRDCGRLSPLLLEPSFKLLNVGEVDGTEEPWEEGLVGRGRWVPFLGGEGESSIIKTHPEESFCLGFSSWDRLTDSELRRAKILLLSSEGVEDFARPGRVTGGETVEAARLLRVVTLPRRNRGTRVWIFCSRTLTLARISDTICTPLFFDVNELVDA